MTYTYVTEFGPDTILAPCLQVLCSEIAAKYPGAVNLGEIGDTSHQIEGYSSDHNPFIVHNGKRYVRAIDIGGPVEIQDALEAFFASRYAAKDIRVYPYGYSHKDNQVTTWFGGGETHYDAGDVGHLHISVTQANGNDPSPSGWVPALDSRAPWGLISTQEDDMYDAAAEKRLMDKLSDVYNGIVGPQRVDNTRLGNAVHAGPDEMPKLFATLTAKVGALAALVGEAGGLTAAQAQQIADDAAAKAVDGITVTVHAAE